MDSKRFIIPRQEDPFLQVGVVDKLIRKLCGL